MDEKDENGEFYHEEINWTWNGILYFLRGRNQVCIKWQEICIWTCKETQETQSLPTIIMATKALETCEQSQPKQPNLQYRAPPPITSFLKKAADKVAPPPPPSIPEPVAVSLADRKSHLEAQYSFVAEHDLSLSLPCPGPI